MATRTQLGLAAGAPGQRHRSRQGSIDKVCPGYQGHGRQTWWASFPCCPALSLCTLPKCIIVDVCGALLEKIFESSRVTKCAQHFTYQGKRDLRYQNSVRPSWQSNTEHGTRGMIASLSCEKDGVPNVQGWPSRSCPSSRAATKLVDSRAWRSSVDVQLTCSWR